VRSCLTSGFVYGGAQMPWQAIDMPSILFAALLVKPVNPPLIAYEREEEGDGLGCIPNAAHLLRDLLCQLIGALFVGHGQYRMR
jgi:hypothetical protein